MPELGGMGILKATNMNEFKELCILKNYIIRQHIPCDLEIYFRDKHSGPSSEVVFVYDEGC